MKCLTWADVLYYYYHFDIKVKIDYRETKDSDIINKALNSILDNVDDKEFLDFISTGNKDYRNLCVPIELEGTKEYVLLVIEK